MTQVSGGVVDSLIHLLSLPAEDAVHSPPEQYDGHRLERAQDGEDKGELTARIISQRTQRHVCGLCPAPSQIYRAVVWSP